MILLTCYAIYNCIEDIDIVNRIFSNECFKRGHVCLTIMWEWGRQFKRGCYFERYREIDKISFCNRKI